jgi:hypothetical protein
VGQRVQVGIFNSDFAVNAAALATPFPVLLLIVALIYFWPHRRNEP